MNIQPHIPSQDALPVLYGYDGPNPVYNTYLILCVTSKNDYWTQSFVFVYVVIRLHVSI